MERQNRFDYYKPLTISMVVVGVGLILGSLILLSRIISNDKSDAIKKEEGHVHTPHNPEHPNVEATAKERADAKAKQKGNTVSTSTSLFDPHPSNPHQDERQLGNNPLERDRLEQDEEVVILDENDYLDENGNIADPENWCLARMHKNGWFKPEDIPIIYEDPNGQPDGVYIWTEYKETGPLKFEDAPEEVKARAKALKEELDLATEVDDGREVIRIAKALDELHRPYRSPSKVTLMHAGSIPSSWKPYFDNIFQTEIQEMHPEVRRHTH